MPLAVLIVSCGVRTHLPSMEWRGALQQQQHTSHGTEQQQKARQHHLQQHLEQQQQHQQQQHMHLQEQVVVVVQDQSLEEADQQQQQQQQEQQKAAVMAAGADVVDVEPQASATLSHASTSAFALWLPAVLPLRRGLCLSALGRALAAEAEGSGAAYELFVRLKCARARRWSSAKRQAEVKSAVLEGSGAVRRRRALAWSGLYVQARSVSSRTCWP